jgi:hypothetical protein
VAARAGRIHREQLEPTSGFRRNILMAWLCGFALVVLLVTVVGHLLWLFAASILNGLLGTTPAGRPRPLRPFRYCPGCRAETREDKDECPECGLVLDGQRARALHRIRMAEREIRALVGAEQVDRTSAEPILDQLETRARLIQGLPVAKRRHARPVAPAPVPEPESLAPPDAVTLLPESTGKAAPPAGLPRSLPEPLPAPEGDTESPALLSTAGAALADAGAGSPPTAAPTPEPEPLPSAPLEPAEPSEPRPPVPPPPPKRRLSHFLEEHNILWGELVGGLLIVGCSIALVVTLRQTLEELRYFQFMLSAAVTLGLFGAGQYTLHRWKLAGTSRGMLVISLLLTPLTLLLLTEPFAPGAEGPLDIGVKLAALAVFVAVVRTGGRDLIGTDHLPGPVDRRWLIALAVVGAAGTQLLPTVSPWLPLLCFVVACAATLGGLSWYHPSRREEPITDKSATALLMFVGLAGFALLAAWGLYLWRATRTGSAPNELALPLALAGVPVVEAGVLVLRRATAVGLRTVGTATALVGFVAMTMGLALAWPTPLSVLLVAAATGAFLTRVAFRERLPWVQAGALPLLALAAILGFHGITGNWTVPAGVSAHNWLSTTIGSPESGVVLTGFALVLALVAELLARSSSQQAQSYAIGTLAVGTAGLLIVNWHGIKHPAVAVFAHAALAGGMLATNKRYQLRSLAHGGLWLGLGATMWALWWLAPRQPDLWGFVVAVEALVFAAGAVALRGVHGGATALLRRAGRDVSFVACVLAVVLALTSFKLESPWHARTLFALSLALVSLARLTGARLFTLAGSAALLLALVHLNVYALDSGSNALGIALGILLHATFITIAAVVCRRQARVFGDPFRWCALVSAGLAVPLLVFPPTGLAFVYAPLAVWLAGLWLAFVLLWRTTGAFGAFQGAITLAALLTAFGWIERQPWWATTMLQFRDPRALQSFGFALGALALVWVIARRALRANTRARELWCADPLSLDRFVLGATVIGLLLLAVVAITPAVKAELTPTTWSIAPSPPELTHAFDPPAWVVLALLAGAVLLSWRLTDLGHDTGPHAIGLALLGLAVPVVWAGTHDVDIASASALRWGLSMVFVSGSAMVALREQLRRAALATGFPVRPEWWLRPTLLVLLAIAAGVVVLLSADVASMGLSRLAPSGPDARSIFKLMGPMASNLTPLALVVLGLAVTAARERSSGYALSGGLVFVATLTAGYALSVVTAGNPLDATEQTRLFLVAATSAAVWALVWLAFEWRVPGGIPLGVQVCLGFGALGLIALVPALALVTRASEPLPAAFEPLGQFGWFTLAAVTAAGFWQARRVVPPVLPLVFGFAGLVAGVLPAASVRSFDVPGWWLSFHIMALVWVATGIALFAAYRRNLCAHGLLTVLAGAVVACALRSGWYDPWKPWFPTALALSAAVILGGLALRTRLIPFVISSGAAVNLAAIFVWIAWGPDTFTGFVLTNVIGIAVTTACWTLIRIRQAAPDNKQWLVGLDNALVVAAALLVVGLTTALGGRPSNPWSLTWGATGAVALACVVGLWDHLSDRARPVLYATGILAALLAVAEADPIPVWNSGLAPLALAAFVLGTAALALAILRRGKPLLGIPANHDWRYWLPRAQIVNAASAVALGVRIGLLAPSIWERLASPLAVVFLAPAFVMLMRIAPRTLREEMRALAVVLVALAPTALALAAPAPLNPFAWLHRTGWLFVALAFTAVGGSEIAPRLADNWRRIARTVTGWCAGAAMVVLCVNLLQQVPVYDPKLRITPLAREASLSMLVAIAALLVLALRFALKPDRDPFDLRPARRTGYVYLAEVFLVLFFAQVRLNVPEIFLGELAKLWTFAVMVLAYVGIGLAELFERKKIDVLAVPLRRTGVLLPLVPLIAFWAKPPAFVTDFARDAAPGLTPFLNYLANLPQHFDTYAWLWFLAGGAYALVALSRNSFGWALLAALSTNAALWALLTHHQVPFIVHPQVWVIPFALIVLVSEHVNRSRLSADVSNSMRYAGIALIYVASSADMFIAGVGNSLWLPVILAVLCVAGVLAGMWLRVRAFIYLGVGFLMLDLFSMIWYAAVDLQQTWVWYASGIVLGVMVLALFAYLEKRRTHEKEVVE